jgi:hypothetical protein
LHQVVNWLWQGSALTLAAALAIRSAPRLSATTRYVVWWTTMVLVLVLPLLPWLMSLSGAPPLGAAAGSGMAPMALPDLPPWPFLIAAAGWAGWVIVFFVRLLVSLATLVLARRLAAPFPRAREARLTHWPRLVRSRRLRGGAGARVSGDRGVSRCRPAPVR